MSRRTTGHFISHGLKLEPHEQTTIDFFLHLGRDVELIPPSSSPHTKRPDFIMEQLIWEMKSPTISRIKSLERLFYRAAQQSPNIILDLRRLTNSPIKGLAHIQKLFLSSRRIKNLLIITKDGTLLEFHK